MRTPNGENVATQFIRESFHTSRCASRLFFLTSSALFSIPSFLMATDTGLRDGFNLEVIRRHGTV